MSTVYQPLQTFIYSFLLLFLKLILHVLVSFFSPCDSCLYTTQCLPLCRSLFKLSFPISSFQSAGELVERDARFFSAMTQILLDNLNLGSLFTRRFVALSLCPCAVNARQFSGYFPPAERPASRWQGHKGLLLLFCPRALAEFTAATLTLTPCSADAPSVLSRLMSSPLGEKRTGGRLMDEETSVFVSSNIYLRAKTRTFMQVYIFTKT